MLLVAFIIFLLWLFGFIGHVGGGLIHILLVIALILAIVRLSQGKPVL